VYIKADTVKNFINEQVKKLERIRMEEDKDKKARIPIIIISMEPGSGGSVVAQNVARRLGLDFFHREIVHEIAESGKLPKEDLLAMEKERLSGIQDFISSLISDRYLWPGLYLEHLTKVVEAIAKRGNALIVGRGASFILSSKKCLSLRIVAPLEIRVQNVVQSYGATPEDARRRIVNRESKRGAFVKQSFNEDIANPHNYDLAINTGRLSLEESEDAPILFYLSKYLSA